VGIMFDSEEYQLLLDGFIEYATEHLNLQPSTISRYKVILDDYFQSYVINKCSADDYNTIFSIEKLSLITRKSNNVRPSLIRFLEFLRDEKLIEESTYFLLENNVKATQTYIPENLDREDKIEFLTPNEIRRLFSNRLEFKHEYEKKTIPLYCALSFFYMFKQKDIIKLELSDVDLENKRIKNVRKANNPESELVEWLSLNQITLDYIKEYLPYRSSLKFNGTELLIMSNRNGDIIGPLDNEKINRLFGCLHRRNNALLFGNKGIHSEMLMRSMMLYILLSTDGQGLYQMLLEQEMNNSALEYAFNEYVSIVRAQNQNNIIERYNIEDILPNRKSPKQTKEKALEGTYSEANDINENDIGDYDMDNERNLEQNKVSIQRMVRDSRISRKLKDLYEDKCQLCDHKLRKSNGDYVSEGHHIKPYNRVHRGDDNGHNMIVLCPNCHTQFDDLYYAIHPDTEEVHCIFGEEEKYHLSNLTMHKEHKLHKMYLEYTWQLFEEKKSKIQRHNNNKTVLTN